MSTLSLFATPSTYSSDASADSSSATWTQFAGAKRFYRPNIVPNRAKGRAEDLHLTYNDAVNVAVLPGQHISQTAVSRLHAKTSLLELVHRFTVIGFPNANGGDGKITEATADAAKLLFRSLPVNAKLPKITPDGEGGLMAVWEDGNAPLVLIVDDWKIHLVKAATTPDAEYFHDLRFDGETIPKNVIESIPTA